jgi:hypothetical protein
MSQSTSRRAAIAVQFIPINTRHSTDIVVNEEATANDDVNINGDEDDALDAVEQSLSKKGPLFLDPKKLMHQKTPSADDREDSSSLSSPTTPTPAPPTVPQKAPPKGSVARNYSRLKNGRFSIGKTQADPPKPTASISNTNGRSTHSQFKSTGIEMPVPSQNLKTRPSASKKGQYESRNTQRIHYDSPPPEPINKPHTRIQKKRGSSKSHAAFKRSQEDSDSDYIPTQPEKKTRQSRPVTAKVAFNAPDTTKAESVPKKSQVKRQTAARRSSAPTKVSRYGPPSNEEDIQDSQDKQEIVTLRTISGKRDKPRLPVISTRNVSPPQLDVETSAPLKVERVESALSDENSENLSKSSQRPPEREVDNVAANQSDIIVIDDNDDDELDDALMEFDERGTTNNAASPIISKPRTPSLQLTTSPAKQNTPSKRISKNTFESSRILEEIRRDTIDSIIQNNRPSQSNVEMSPLSNKGFTVRRDVNYGENECIKVEDFRNLTVNQIVMEDETLSSIRLQSGSVSMARQSRTTNIKREPQIRHSPTRSAVNSARRSPIIVRTPERTHSKLSSLSKWPSNVVNKVDNPVVNKTPSADIQGPPMRTQQPPHKTTPTTIFQEQVAYTSRPSNNNSLNSFHTKLAARGIRVSPTEMMSHQEDDDSDSCISSEDVSDSDEELGTQYPPHQQTVRDALYEITDVGSLVVVTVGSVSKVVGCRIYGNGVDR